MTEPVQPASAAAALLTSLLGTWHLQRSIPGHAEAIGSATLTLLPDQPSTALYQERVTLRTTTPNTAPATLTATQQYLFAALAGPVLHIHRLPGPELFHTLHLSPAPDGALAATSTQLCSPDTYRSTYTFGPGSRWRTIHHVTGPRKSYQATTLYTRPLT